MKTIAGVWDLSSFLQLSRFLTIVFDFFFWEGEGWVISLSRRKEGGLFLRLLK